MKKLDRYDLALLQLLQRDGRMPNARLAERVALSESSCLRRLKTLEESGLIEGYTVLVNQHKAGFPVNVFVSVTLDKQDRNDLESFETAVREIPEIMECYLMTGEFDYLVRVAVADMADFERVHNQILTRLPGVVRVNSSVALRAVKRSQMLPLDGARALHHGAPVCLDRRMG